MHKGRTITHVTLFEDIDILVLFYGYIYCNRSYPEGQIAIDPIAFDPTTNNPMTTTLCLGDRHTILDRA